MAYYVYILRCSDNSLYTGYTNNLYRRVIEHNETNRGAKYTRCRRPCELVYFESYEFKSAALKREYFIKHYLSKKDKEKLVAWGDLNNELSVRPLE